jgi:hypothetical protein
MESLDKSTINVSNGTQCVRAYLRCLGFEDDRTVGRLSDWIYQHVKQEKPDVDPEQAALGEVLARRAIWFTAINEYMAQGQPGSDPLVGWHFRRMIQKRPDAFLGEPDRETLDLPAALTVRAVPPIRESEMPSQPLQPLPAGLRLQFWRSVAAGLKGTRQKLMAYWGRE